MKILTVDVGTGTQDIFLYDSELDLENGYKLVMPSPTLLVRRRLREIVRLSDTNRMQSGHDYVLVGRRAALKLPFDRIAQDFEGALRRMQAGRNGNTGSR